MAKEHLDWSHVLNIFSIAINENRSLIIFSQLLSGGIFHPHQEGKRRQERGIRKQE